MVKNNKCIDCGKSITFSSLRCRSCVNKSSRNPVYIDGRHLKTYYCKEKELKNLNKVKYKSLKYVNSKTA